MFGSISLASTQGFITRAYNTLKQMKPSCCIRREFGNLQDIKDNYPKYVISMDPVSGELPEYPGIHHLHLREFLKTDL